MGKNNTGYNNSGNRNSGNWNSGNRNSGYGNSGYGNSGNMNSGNWNSGDRNSGNRNSGNWNSGDWNSGYFNIDEPKVRIFGKETEVAREDIVFPDYFWFDLNVWVGENDMTDKEKEENDQYKVAGGYLKTKGYREAWREAWDKASDEDRRKTLALPNWNNEIFKEITGIDVENELNKSSDIIVVDGKEYSMDTVKRALREYVK